MKSAADWVVEQCLNSPRVGSLEHKMMCDCVRDIQRDALLEAFKLVREKHSITGAADAILEYAETLTPPFHSTSGGKNE